MMEELESFQSSYAALLAKIISDVQAALTECEDITMYLEPMRSLLEETEEAEFAKISTTFDQIMHVLKLVWENSKFYSTPRHIVVLLREQLNSVIHRISGHVEPRTLFSLEPLEAVPKLQEALELIAHVKASFAAIRAKVNDPERDGKRWTFASTLIFEKLDSYNARLLLLQKVVKTRCDFEKLEKVELSDPVHSAHVQDIFTEYNEQYTAWQKRTVEDGEGTYDPLNPTPSKFESDFHQYHENVLDFDLRLGAIAKLAFKGQNCIEGTFKIIHGWQGLLEHRDVLIAETSSRYPLLLEEFSDELDHVKEHFDHEKEAKTLTKNMPLVAGALAMNDHIRHRLKAQFHEFVNMGPEIPSFNNPRAEIVYKKYHEMVELLQDQDRESFKVWASSVGSKSDVNLNQFLLLRDAGSRMLSINFDPQLVAVLREVKYLEREEHLSSDLPEDAAAIYARNETFRQFLGNLGIAVAEYNRIQTTLMDVEAPLIIRELNELDISIEKAVCELNWNSEGVMEYCLDLSTKTNDLSQRLQDSKQNVSKITERLAEWFQIPMLLRDDKTGLLSHKDRQKQLAKVYVKITQGGKEFYELVKANAKCFRADPASKIWEDYVDYMDGLVLDGLYNVSFKSLSYLLDNMDEVAQELPLMFGNLELKTIPFFTPGLVQEDTPNGPMLGDWFTDLHGDFCKIGELVPRLARHTGQKNYQAELLQSKGLNELKEELDYKCHSVQQKAQEYLGKMFEGYEYLWKDDRDKFLEQFIKYNHVLTNEELEAWAEENSNVPFPESAPTLEMYKENIDKFAALADSVLSLNDMELFDRWFRVDTRPFRTSLHSVVTKWRYMFIKQISDHLSATVKELGAFITVCSDQLAKPMPTGDEGSYEALVGVMQALNDMKSREESIDAVFQPLQEQVTLLTSYSVDIPVAVLNELNKVPDQWSATKKLSARISQDVAPAQADEVTKLKREANKFDVRNFEFREDFNKRAPLRFEATDVYNRLDAHYNEYVAMEAEMSELERKSTLFVVRLPEYKQLRACRKELSLLKSLWDTVFVVRYQFEKWATTPWTDVDVEAMEMDCKKLIKDIRLLDKDTRAWEAFNGVDAEVKNMVVSLSAVGLLQSKAIRKRHWEQVMVATGVQIDMGPNSVAEKTTLKDLLSLHLHEYEEEVAGIVDKAAKELQMEKMLAELEETWAGFHFEYKVHKRRGTAEVAPAEEMIEVLQDNQVQLQNLLASKYIAFFAEQVGSWSMKLSNADQVIEIWGEVQRTWSNLESIFIGSEDIRAQLPVDAKRFDEIDAEYIEVVTRCSKITNVIEVTNQDKLFDQFESMQDRLSLCEKALNEYLDTKRLAFPRFYFVSSADLLDILSNGNNPPAVAKQLSKLFNVIADLKIPEAEEGKYSGKQATGMYALDGEYVEFRDKVGPVLCDCEGRVEVWLMTVLICMQESLRWYMKDAFITYEEKPRSEWVFDNCAQVTLVGTQVWWATEVNIAFNRLEEGYENAMKEYVKKAIGALNELVTLLQGSLPKEHRVMLQTTCTVDVHSRDVTLNLIHQKADNAGAFLWLSQLRHRYDDKDDRTHISICDARFVYKCEYLGNQPRLVITPLTDRCYITLTQSLHLQMSGAPAGPAGTGKTETTKDLSRNIGIMIYVFNCSEQMDYKSTGNIYKGLAQSGAWGCFDEFNRISIEVLSVVAVQVKTVQDAIKANKKRFNFLGEDIALDQAVGMWITMNPGYAGRTALPENIKALFRPCAMVVPDFGMICEIMLVSEGFLTAQALGLKFITLYSLNRDLLSKQDHYDWGLRAIKSVLVVAGKLKRADPARSEDEVLMRALRDFNIPKIVNEDLYGVLVVLLCCAIGSLAGVLAQ
jgi:dynein heavy chain